jgi:hypothetical protein
MERIVSFNSSLDRPLVSLWYHGLYEKTNCREDIQTLYDMQLHKLIW